MMSNNNDLDDERPAAPPDPLELLERLAVPGLKLPMRDLRALSGILPRQREEISGLWRKLPAMRQLETARAMVELAESNVDLDFREIFYLCLDSSDHELRSVAVEGLWEDESRETMQRLMRLLLHDPAPQVRAAAASNLGRFAYLAELGELDSARGAELEQALLQLAADPAQPVEVRQRCIESLGYYANSAAAQQLIGTLYRSMEPALRAGTLVAMGRSMLPRWHETIVNELRSVTPALRYEAARAVGEQGENGQTLLPALMPLVDDDDAEVALAAIWALGEVGGTQAKRVLQRLARSKDEARSEAAEEALRALEMLEE